MSWYTIDRRLISIKICYLLILSGVAALIPYLPIFLTQLGIKSAELGLIYGLIFLITFVKNSLVGFITDKYQLHRLVLIISCVLTGPLYCALMGVPSTPLQSTDINLQCAQSMSRNDRCIDDSYVSCEAGICKKFPLEETRLCADVNCSSTVSNISGLRFSDQNLLEEYLNQSWIGCQVSYNCVKESYSSLTFWLCLVITLTAALCGSNELVLNDTIALSVLDGDRGKWGKSRLCGSVGYGITTILVSLLIDKLASSSVHDIDYTPAFLIYLVVSLLAALVSGFHPHIQSTKSPAILKGFGEVLLDVRVTLFLILVLILGMLNGLFITFAYRYLRFELQANQLCLGLCVLVTVLVEIPTLFFGGLVVRKIGEMACLYIALAAYAVRFISYAYIPSPWWALLVDTTHLFTYALMYTAAMVYASKIVPKQLIGTMIGLVNGLKWGLGLGLGSIIGGNLLEKVTFHRLFIGAGVLAMSVLVLYVLLFELILKLLKPAKSSSSQVKTDEGAAESISAEARELKGFTDSSQTDADPEHTLDSADPFLQK